MVVHTHTHIYTHTYARARKGLLLQRGDAEKKTKRAREGDTTRAVTQTSDRSGLSAAHANSKGERKGEKRSLAQGQQMLTPLCRRRR